MFLFRFFKKNKRQIKIGYALGSGGAKGFATLGVIKALEENDIYPDVIAGTSIGSIIGALLANGYSSTDITEMLKSFNLGKLINAVMLSVDGDAVKSTLDDYLGEKNFNELKKPFSAIATDLHTGEEVVLNSGNVASAITASSCYPPFFKPYEIDGELLVDGAFTNSVPADVVKNLGADFIIGVDLSDHQSKPSILSRIFPTYQGKVEKPWQKGYEYSDIVLQIPLSGYKSTSFKDGEVMFNIGYNFAKEKIQEIKGLLDNAKKKNKRKK